MVLSSLHPLNNRILSSDQLLQSWSGHGLGSLQREAKSSVPDQAGGHTQGSGDAEEHGVVVHLLHSVVLQVGSVVMTSSTAEEYLPAAEHRSGHLRWARGS